MNRYTRAAAAALLMVGGLGSLGCVTTGKGGGSRYRNAVDPSWPDRYNYAAREAVMAPFAQQVANGHFEERTLWNWYFEPGSDRLHPAGMAKLDAISRRPNDNKLFLQYAGDLPLTPDNAATIVDQRHELTAKRAAIVRQYLATKPGTPEYDIAVHNGAMPSIYAPFSVNAFRGQRAGYVGGIQGGADTGVGASLGSGNNTGNVGAAGGTGGSGSGVAPTPTGTPGGAPTGTPGGTTGGTSP
jgi:hypothetical protein